MGTRALAFVAFAAILSLFATTAAATTLYTITDLGTLGGNESHGFGLNDIPQAVGWIRDPPDVHAFLWEGGAMDDLGTLGGTHSTARSVNNLGQVIGGADMSDEHEHAFLWLPEPDYGLPAGMNDLGTLDGTSSLARDVNNAGQVTGEASTSYLEKHAFLWADGTMTDLGTLGGTYCIGFGINELGQVAGVSNLDYAGPFHAFLWLPEPAYGLPAGMNDLGLFGDAQTVAFRINDHGQIVGTFVPGDGVRRALLWENGVMHDLGTLGGDRSSAGGINNEGQIVGYSEVVVGDSTRHAFLNSGGMMRDLNDLIDPASGWVLSSASDINEAGWIVGTGYIGGVTHAYLLTPIPEPSTPALVALGVLGLAWAARRRA
jgi:probable HAF family extracellular repeat protein